jgi:Domain of unknown function (DUF5666)
MKETSSSISKWIFSATAFCLAVALQACSGGGGSAASSGSTNQVASGVVTGFGSVFVDGVELEDGNASVVTENYDGTTTNTVLQMGQRVRVAHDGKGTANKVTLDAAVIGSVSAINTATTPNTLTVAGQKVTVVTDITVGALTVWGGYSSITDVVVNDLVEVHGTPLYDSTTQTYNVNATRIAKVTTSTGRMQVAGTISGLNPTAQTFALNGLTVNYATATLRPSGATLANGTVVTAYAPATALSGSTVIASHIKVNRLQDSTLSVSNAQIGGQVSKYDSVAKTFEVQGTKILIGAGTTVNPSGKTVSNGAYVNVSGTVGSDGSITATNIQVREQSISGDLATVKLLGVISDYVSDTSFVVRGVPVDASGINVSSKCPGLTSLLNYTGSVQVTATQQANTPVVYATDLSCQTLNAIVIRPVDGTASNVDTTAQTFTLTLTNSNTTQAVQWNSNTTFVGVTTATLANSTVRVEGYLSGSTLIARTISATSSSGHMDDDAFRTVSNTINAVSNTWVSYRNNHPHH